MKNTNKVTLYIDYIECPICSKKPKNLKNSNARGNFTRHLKSCIEKGQNVSKVI